MPHVSMILNPPNQARVWGIAGAKPLGELSFKGHKDSVSAVTISPDSKYIVTTSEDNTAIVWPMLSLEETGKVQVEPIAKLEGHHDNVICAAIGPPANHLVVITASKDNTARCWHVPV